MINALLSFFYNVISFLIPFAVTVFLGWAAWKLWVHYVRTNFIAGIEWVLLEIVPPSEVTKSPQAMELFFTNALYMISKKGLFERYWVGAVWFWFSLEIVSIDGQVHFFVRTPSRVKQLVETQIYAQYPQAQVRIAEDYTLGVDEITPKSEWNLWGCEFGLTKPEAYPIKTYADFGLDKDPDEENKIDPISPVIELFASIQKGEQMWLQIVVTAAQRKYKTKGVKGTHDWIKESQLELDKIAYSYTKFENRAEAGGKKPAGLLKSGRTPDFLEPLLGGVTEKMLRLGFDCGIRACYIAKKDVFANNRRRQKDLRLIFRQYASPYLNSFNRINSTQFDYPWQFTTGSMYKLKNRVLTEYRERSFFYPPLRHKIRIPWPISTFFPKFRHHEIFVLNTQELATIWHFPGQVLKVPTLERIESKEAAPPTNLPI
jgi:hypothetical protein